MNATFHTDQSIKEAEVMIPNFITSQYFDHMPLNAHSMRQLTEGHDG